MFRRLHLILPPLIIAFLANPSCRKQAAEANSDRQDLIQQARAVIDSLSTHGDPANYRASQPRTIRWDLAQLVPLGQLAPLSQRQGLLAPITFDNPLLIQANFSGTPLFHIDYLTKLFYYTDSTGHPTAVVLTDFPDSNYFKDPTRAFTGIRFVEDWYGHPIEKLLYTPNGQIRRYTPTTVQPSAALAPQPAAPTTVQPSVPTTVQPTAVEIIQTCYTITGYNYSPELNETYSWTEPAGCNVDFLSNGATDPLAPISGNNPGSGGGAGARTPAPSVTVLPGTSVIKSIKTYFQCFTNVGGSDHTYSVTVCVDQPDPGTRTPWTFTSGGSSGSSQANNVVNTGHTFLILAETYGSTTITRNVGFYPSGLVMPSSPSSPGELNNDQNHFYNISGTFTVDNGQFFNILNFVSSESTATYNLNSNNCTTFAINAMNEGGIKLPATLGTWPGGAGDDPGDFGQDMKSASITGMKLNLTPGNSQANTGQCD